MHTPHEPRFNKSWRLSEAGDAMPSTYVIVAIGCLEEFYGPTQMNQTFRRQNRLIKGGRFFFFPRFI